VADVPGPLTCRLGPATSWFTGVRVLQLPAAGLDELAAAVRAGTLAQVPEPAGGEQPFNGHLTLARAKGRRPASPSAHLAGLPLDVAFEVSSVDLVSSTPSPDGHVYAIVARAALGPGG
jgi:2'-5' RNA ligase